MQLLTFARGYYYYWQHFEEDIGELLKTFARKLPLKHTTGNLLLMLYPYTSLTAHLCPVSKSLSTKG
jgi:hypothetical protein